MILKQIVKGISTVVPGMNKYCCRGTGGTNSARYCYSVWLRHLVLAGESGLGTYPKIVAELGPGDSLGIGLAALISGCEKYFAFDIVEHANVEKNLVVFDEIVFLFKNKAGIPGVDEFPKLNPCVKSYEFPENILGDRLQIALAADRLEKIRWSIQNLQNSKSLIQYKAPWDDLEIVEHGSVDMIYSQAVFEHVDQLQHAYHAMSLWLSRSGFMSHQVDFKSHGTADEWNGHWLYSDFLWKVIRGKRPYLINREPYSTHRQLLEKSGFKVVAEKKVTLPSNIKRKQLASRFRGMSDKDFEISGAFFQAVRDRAS